MKRNPALDEEGSVSLFLVVAMAGVFLALGLVVDGGRLVTASQAAHEHADEAARAAGQQIAHESVQAGEEPRLLPRQAKLAAQRYLAAAGYTSQVVIRGQEIVVSAETTTDTVFLRMFGIDQLAAHGEGAAVLVP